DHRERADLINLRFTRHAVEQIGCDAKLNPTAPAAAHHHIKQGVAIHARVSKDLFVGAGIAIRFRKALEISDDGHALKLVWSGTLRWQVLHNPDHAIAERGSFSHFLNAQRRFGPAPDHES